jgi:glycosyltransferase involved in cell wall biosynthesis
VKEIRLRILILVDCYYPSTKSSAKLAHDLAVEFCRRGNRVTVMAPSEIVSERVATTTEDGVSVVRVKSGQIKGVNKVQRAANEARLSANLWRKAQNVLRKNPCDLILFYSPTIFFGPLVRRLKQLWSCPAYLILRDIFPDWAVDAGLLRKGLIYRFFREAAAQQYKSADLIALQSPANGRYFAHAYPQHESRLRVLFNWAPLREPQLPRTDYRAQLGLGNKVVFFYGGNIGVAQDIDNIVRLATRLDSRSDIHFLMVGDGSESRRLKNSIGVKRLHNIQILPSVSQSDYLAMVSEFDVGLISLDARLTSHNFPGKLLSYLYWGMPVLASVNPGNDLVALLQESGAGLCFSNGDDENLISAARRLADDIVLRSEMGRNARRLLEHTFSVEHAVNQILAHLREARLVTHGGESKTRILDDHAMRTTEVAEQFEP